MLEMVINRNPGMDMGSDLPGLMDFLSSPVSICVAYAVPAQRWLGTCARGSCPAVRSPHSQSNGVCFNS